MLRIFALMLLLAATPLAAATEIVVDDEYPLRDTPTKISVLVDGQPVSDVVIEASYRPNSQSTYQEVLPPTSADGSVLWTPADPGLVTLSAFLDGEDTAATSRNIAVRFGSFPTSGKVTMGLAGLLLFGGAIAGFLVLLKNPGTAMPPST